MVTEMNALLARLAATLERERGFLADAAHELRTPLAVIQAQGDVLMAAATAPERDAAALAMRAGLARASALLRQLLALARAAGEFDERATSVVTLDAFVEQRLADFAGAAIARDIELSLDVDPAARGATVEVQSDALQSIVDNVIDNAIRYTPAGGHVGVALVAGADSMVELTVTDDGPGLSADERGRAFDRFWRGSGHDQPGSGLGLAIVRDAVRRVGGRVSLDDGLGGRGLTVRVTVPRRS
jgi:signal transduction histidine kinase